MAKMTVRELQVMRLVALREQDISNVLKITPYTVRELKHRAFNKLKVKNRVQAVLKLINLGFIQPREFVLDYGGLYDR